MGAKLTTEALVSSSTNMKRNSQRISDVILAAPDIDRDVFTKEVVPTLVGPLQMTMYASRNDAALKISEQINEAPRLGSTLPTPVVVPGLHTIDASAVDTSFIGHSYYGDNKSIIADIFYIVRERLPPQRRANLRPASINGLNYWTLAN